MPKTETRQRDGRRNKAAALCLGALLALGIEMIVLLLGSFTVSAGILRPDATLQITAASCLIGCFAGGMFACRSWEKGRLLCGIAVGVTSFALICLVALVSTREVVFGSQGLVEVSGCMIGGCLAGLMGRGKRKKRRKIR